jgi:hypothetical protein
LPRPADPNSIRSLAKRAGLQLSLVHKLLKEKGMTPDEIVEHGRIKNEKRGEFTERDFSRAKEAPIESPVTNDGGFQAKLDETAAQTLKDEPAGTYRDAILRKETAIANLRELELAEKRGDLVSRKEAEAAWENASVCLRDGILSVPDRIALQLEGRTAREIREMMMTELRRALELASSQIEQAA